MQKKFKLQLDQIVTKSEAVLLAVGRDATQQVIDDAQLPVAKGGRMRVDTGFLRASGIGSLDGMPTGPSRRGEGQQAAEDVSLILNQMTEGDTFSFGWTANYAQYREAEDGFLRLAIQRWQDFVDISTEKARARLAR